MTKRRVGSKLSTWDAETGAQITYKAGNDEIVEIAYHVQYMIAFHT